MSKIDVKNYGLLMEHFGLKKGEEISMA